jgi:hypothetical protein
VLDIWVEQPRRPYPSFVRTHISLARLRALGGETSSAVKKPLVDDAINEISALLAVAHKRRALEYQLQDSSQAVSPRSSP